MVFRAGAARLLEGGLSSQRLLRGLGILAAHLRAGYGRGLIGICAVPIAAAARSRRVGQAAAFETETRRARQGGGQRKERARERSRGKADSAAPSGGAVPAVARAAAKAACRTAEKGTEAGCRFMNTRAARCTSWTDDRFGGRQDQVAGRGGADKIGTGCGRSNGLARAPPTSPPSVFHTRQCRAPARATVAKMRRVRSCKEMGLAERRPTWWRPAARARRAHVAPDKRRLVD